MTSHDYDAHLDAISVEAEHCEYQHDLVLAQLQDEAEMKEAYDAKLRFEGAMQALRSAKNYLMYSFINREMDDEKLLGIKFAIDSLEYDMQKLESENLPVEVGGDFPEGYFKAGGAA
jgi:hypothetical protein